MWFSKAGSDRIVYGPASTSILDKQGDIVTTPALRKSLATLLLNRALSLNHTDLIPGVILPSYTTESGAVLKTEVRPVTDVDLSEFPRLGENGVKKGDETMFIVGKIHNDPVLAPYADDVWSDVMTGTLNSFSISGKATGVSFKQDCAGFTCKLAKHIEDMAISAVALCRRGANPSASFNVYKSLDNYVIHSPKWELAGDLMSILKQMDHRVMTGCDKSGHIAITAAHLRKYVDEHTIHDATAPHPVHVDPESLREARDAMAPPLPGHDPEAPANPLNPPPSADPQKMVDDQAEKGKNALAAATASAVPAPPIPKKPTVGVKVPDHNPSLAKSLELRLRIAKGVSLKPRTDEVVAAKPEQGEVGLAQNEDRTMGREDRYRTNRGLRSSFEQAAGQQVPVARDMKEVEFDLGAYGNARSRPRKQFAEPDGEFIKAELDAEERGKIPDSKFADPKNRRYPVQDKAHADNAAARASQQGEKGSILDRIKAAQEKFSKTDTRFNGQPIETDEQKAARIKSDLVAQRGKKYEVGMKDLGTGITYKSDKKSPERHTGRPDKPDGPPTKEKEVKARGKWRPVPYTDKHGIRRTGAVNEAGTMLYGQDAQHALSLMSRQGDSPEPGSAGETSDVPTQADRVAGLEERLAQLEGSDPDPKAEQAEDPVKSPEDLTKSEMGASNLIYGDAPKEAPKPVQPSQPKSSIEQELDVARQLLRALHRAKRRTVASPSKA